LLHAAITISLVIIAFIAPRFGLPNDGFGYAATATFVFLIIIMIATI